MSAGHLIQVAINSIAILTFVFLLILLIIRNGNGYYRGGVSFTCLMVCLIVWAFFFVLELFGENLETKVIMVKLQYLGISFVPLCYISYIIDSYSAYRRKRLTAVKVFLCAYGIFYATVSAINPFSLFYSSVELRANGTFNPEYGPLFYVCHTLFIVSIALTACLIWVAVIRGKEDKKRAAVLTASIAAPFLLNVLYVLKITGYDYTCVGFGVSAALLAATTLLFGVIDTKTYVDRNLLYILDESIFLLDKAGKIIFINETAKRLLNLGVFEKAVGKSLNEIAPFMKDPGEEAQFYETSIEKDEDVKYYGVHTILLKKHGNEAGYLIYLRDITSNKVLERKLNYLSDCDYLTGLINDRKLLKVMQEFAYASKAKDLSGTSVVALNVKNKEEISAQLTIEQSHKLLVCLTELLEAVFNGGSSIAFLGGFDFAVFSERQLSVERLSDINKTISSSCMIEDKIIKVEFRIGLYNTGAGIDGAEALSNAVYALNCSAGADNNICEYDSRTMENHSVEKLMAKCLESETLEKWFYLDYQPVLDITTNKIIKAEALLRWNHPELGSLSPALFIPIAEKTAAIFSIGWFVIRSVCNYLSDNEELFSDSFSVALNVSKRQIDNETFADELVQYITHSGIDPKMLEFEITESAVSEDIKNVKRFVEKVKRIGCRVSLDDFGAGNTALAYITDFECDALKIDTNMSADALHDKKKCKILKSINAMCKELEIDVILEHIEDMSTLRFFAKMDFRYIQGYVFSRPLSGMAMAELYRYFNR